MLAVTIATVLSTLCKPCCSLDIFHPYVLDNVDAKSPVAPASCWVKTEAVSTGARHSIEGALSSGGKVSSPRKMCYVQQEVLSQPPQMSPHPTRQEVATSHGQGGPNRFIPTRALRPRIERLDARRDRYKLDTPKTALEAAQCMARSQGARLGSKGRDAYAGDLSRNPESRKMMKNERKRRRLVRSAGSTVIQSLNTSAKADVPMGVPSRKRRALDLGISGTPKFKFNGERASRPKLVRLQNQWCRVRGVDG